MHISRYSKRGSALLIVLGLLSFLMISAVAFSISMRTERSAAAAYRRSLTSRELLATAFADARTVTEYALREQAEFPDLNNPDTQTPERMVPFRYPGSDVYGRLISSRSFSNVDATLVHSADSEPTAHLLDDKVMRHVPPYIANSVYRSLELKEDLYPGQSAGRAGHNDRYYIDWAAGWKPVSVDVPKQKITVAGEEQNDRGLSRAIIGRMAWAVVNVSDSLDINAIGSASPIRGIGLTGSDLAYGFDGRTSKTNYEPEAYDLFDVESDTDPAASSIELPVFCSNADFYWFASRANKSTSFLQVDNGNEEPYAWEAAVELEGDGYFAPFSVYGFWPDRNRRNEKKVGSSNTGNGEEESIRCDEITAETLRSYDAGNGKKLASLYERTVGGGESAAQSFIRFMHDYLDKDSVPSPQSGDDAKGYTEFAWPTVENVPMFCEISYDASDNTFAKNTKDKLQTKLTKNVEEKVENEKELEKTLKNDLDIELELPSLQIGARTYFPGSKLSQETFRIQADAFAMAFATATAGTTEVNIKAPTKPHKYSAGGGASVKGGSEDVFSTSPNVAKLSGGKLEFTLKGEDIPVALPSDTEIKTVKLNFLIDTLFRMRISQGSGNADIVPVASNVEKEFRPEDYPKEVANRTQERTMIEQDAQFFRVSKAVSLTFALKWKQDGEPHTNQDGKTTYTYKLELVKGTQGGTAGEVSVTDPAAANNEVEMAKGNNGTFSRDKAKAKTALTRLSDERGAWFAIEPRYNWLSPMLGSTRSFPGVSFDVPELSSPHWVYYADTELTSGATDLSDPMKEYQNSEEERIPFKWGLEIPDVRYGYNDSDQMLLPAEVGFIPVPIASGKLSPSVNGYSRLKNDDYYNNVAKISYYRTLPITDFDDGAMSKEDYRKYAELATKIGGFGGKDFPEEHRGLIHAYAAQDDYNLSQKLRRQAMLGIPNTVREAAYNTFQRLSTAKDARRIPDEIVTDMQKTLGNIEEPANTEASHYDEFVCDYLFPSVESNSLAQARDWRKAQRLYKGGPSATPERPKQPDFLLQTPNNQRAGFAARLTAYNGSKDSDKKLGQNDATLLVGCARECFGVRQQLFLYILRADAIAYNSARHLSEHVALSTSRAVALVWRDPFGLLPDRVVYYQVL